MGLKLDGIEVSERKLKKVMELLESGLTQQLVLAITEGINLAKSIVPVKTHFLQDSIDIFSITKHRVEFGADAPYAGFVEYGTRNMMARPYLTPAIIEIMARFPKLIVSEHWRALNNG